MPKYLIYKGRPCGSTARSQNRWKKQELIEEAKLIGVSSDGTIDDIVKRLITFDNSPLNNANGKCTYINDSTLTGLSIDEINDNEKVVIDGYCFTADEIIQTLAECKRNNNPYTNKPIWSDRTSFDVFFKQPAFSDSDRNRMLSVFYPSFDNNILQLVEKHIDMYELIGITGTILKSDYSKDFIASTSALSILNNKLLELPTDVRDQFYKLKPSGNDKDLIDIINNHDSCIHRIGDHLIEMYLQIWFNIPTQNRPPLISSLHQGCVNTCIYLGYIAYGTRIEIYLYKFDDDIGKIVSCNFMSCNLSLSDWKTSNGYSRASSTIDEETFRIILDDVENHVDEILVNYAFLKDYQIANKYESF